MVVKYRKISNCRSFILICDNQSPNACRLSKYRIHSVSIEALLGSTLDKRQRLKSQYPHINSPNWSPYFSLKNE